ncbi:NUDIX hydrolase [Goodfellowiella coeruleoviolacea]|uniref:NUDIX domain-containing protein n=1 Tax=Goodfellowiella coeruleoviolacea TaxID=334858 RepID=A0AAE3KK30_9PSEU|nr:NUDIX hydrolase [Goodfellowiella coeruleoviolacea]MCP2168949.1 NUDIX domain-containing protein [Goodfellowiella coeruleoviolacea]
MPSSSGRSGGSKPGRRSRRRGRRLKTVDEISAGGLVLDAEHAKAAVIGRLDRKGRLLWSLPKGHIEAGETAEQTAVREVAEETGIHSTVLSPLGSIDYWFVAEDRRVHKTVHHFLLEAYGGELSDEDVEVTEVAWVPLGELEKLLAYADERRLVRQAGELLNGQASTRTSQGPTSTGAGEPGAGRGRGNRGAGRRRGGAE